MVGSPSYGNFLMAVHKFMVVDPVAIRRQSCSQGQRMYALSLSLTMHEIGHLADVFFAVEGIGNLEMLRP
jgi:hypothetical protein